MNPDEEQYFRNIEEYFLQKRGVPMILSPKEWGLIRDWYVANIPQEVVLRGIDRAFEKRENADKESLSLRYCKRIVSSEYKRFLKSLEGSAEKKEQLPESENIGQYLEHLAAGLEKSATTAAGNSNLSLSDFLKRQHETLLAGIVQPFLKNPPKDLQRVEENLTTIEKEIDRVLLEAISADELTRMKEEAMRELKSFQEKLDVSVYQEMLRRALIKYARKRYGIPRLSLFYM